jgi:hypothetical protein
MYSIAARGAIYNDYRSSKEASREAYRDGYWTYRAVYMWLSGDLLNEQHRRDRRLL